MSEDHIYKDGDIVWVKLGNNWWPGEVTGAHRQPDGLVKHLKKKPYCVVKFFQEDAYEYVKNAKQIFPFQCNKKDEFIRKGNALYNAKNKFMEKFPSDVAFAERRSRKARDDNILIINDRPDSIVKAILGQAITRSTGDYYDNDSSTSVADSNKRRSGDSVTKILNITPQRTSSGSSSTTDNVEKILKPALVKRLPSGGSVDMNFYRCNLCEFTSQRQNVMIMHRRTHTSGNNSSSTVAARSAYVHNNSVTNTPKITSTITSKSDELGPKVNNISATPLLLSRTNNLQTPVSSRTAQKEITEQSANRSTFALRRNQSPLPKNKEPTTRYLGKHTLRNRLVNDNLNDMPSISISDRSSPTLESDEDIIVTTITDNALHKTQNNSYTLQNVQTQYSNSTDSSTTNKLISTPATEIHKRLLADWTDEEKYESDEYEETKQLHDTHHNEAETPMQQTMWRKNEIRPTNALPIREAPVVTIVHTAITNTSNRIRNIPKKDRRDVLKQFISDFTINNTSSSASITPPIVSLDSTNSNSSSDSVVIVPTETIVIDEDGNQQREKQTKFLPRPITLNSTRETRVQIHDAAQNLRKTVTPDISSVRPITVNRGLKIDNGRNRSNFDKSVEIVETILDDDNNCNHVTHNDKNIGRAVNIIEINDYENVESVKSNSKLMDSEDTMDSYGSSSAIRALEELDKMDALMASRSPVTPVKPIMDSDSSSTALRALEELDKMESIMASRNQIEASGLVKAKLASSCFDFHDDEEEDSTESDVLKSIANYKKKYLSPKEIRSQETMVNTETEDGIMRAKSQVPPAQEILHQKDQQLSDEIDKLLEQTTSSVVNVKSVDAIPVRSSIDGKTLLYPEVPVKGLPIKERGKRFFKSRIQSQIDEKDESLSSTSEISTDSQKVCFANEKNSQLQRKDEVIPESLDATNNGVLVDIMKETVLVDGNVGNASEKGVHIDKNLTASTSSQKVTEMEQLNEQNSERSKEKVPANNLPTEVNTKDQESTTTIKTKDKLSLEMNERPTTVQQKSPSIEHSDETLQNKKLDKSTGDLLTTRQNVKESKAEVDQLSDVLKERSVADISLESVDNKNSVSNNGRNVESLNKFGGSAHLHEISPNKSEVINDVNNTLMSEIMTTKVIQAEVATKSNDDLLQEIKVNTDTPATNEISSHASPTDENSSVCISEAGAEFGSPTSMLDDERLPVEISMEGSNEVKSPIAFESMQEGLDINKREIKDASNVACESVKDTTVYNFEEQKANEKLIENRSDIEETKVQEESKKSKEGEKSEFEPRTQSEDRTNVADVVKTENQILRKYSDTLIELEKPALVNNTELTLENDNLLMQSSENINAAYHNKKSDFTDEIISMLDGNEIKIQKEKSSDYDVEIIGKSETQTLTIKSEENKEDTANFSDKTDTATFLPEIPNQIVSEGGNKSAQGSLVQTELNSETLLQDSDDDGIESPPHEPLSGNEQEVFEEPAQKRKITKSKLSTKRKEMATNVVESKPTAQTQSIAKKDNIKTSTYRRSSVEEMAEYIIEFEETTTKRLTRSNSHQTKSQSANVPGFMNELELGKLYCTKGTLKFEESAESNSLKFKNSLSSEKDEAQDLTDAADDKMAGANEVTKRIKVSDEECNTYVPKIPTTKIGTEVVKSEIIGKTLKEKSADGKPDALDFIAQMEVEKTAVSEKQSSRKRRSCFKITPRRSQNSRSLGTDTKSDVQERIEADQKYSIKPSAEKIITLEKMEENKFLQDKNMDIDYVNVKKVIDKYEVTDGEGKEISATEVKETEVETEFKLTTIAAKAEDISKETLRDESTADSKVNCDEITQQTTSSIANALVEDPSVVPVSGCMSTNVTELQTQESNSSLSSFTATTNAAGTVSEIRSFRPRRKTNAMEIEADHQSILGTRHKTPNKNGSNMLNLTPPRANKKSVRTPSPTNISPMEKVRINVDVANPLSSQIANILATASSGQQQATGISLKLNKPATLKRKKSIEDVIPSFIIERPTMAHVQQPSHVDVVDKDAMAHVQSLCPEVQITRKEKLVEVEKRIQKHQQAKKVHGQKSHKVKKSKEVADVANNGMFDINSMPMILDGEQILPENVHYVISPTRANTVGLLETDICNDSSSASGSLCDVTKILQQQIIRSESSTSSPPKHQHGINQQQQTQSQTNNTQLGVDSRGNKYVIIKTPPADLVLQKSLASLQHLPQAQPVPSSTQPLSKPSTSGTLNIGTGVNLRPVNEKKAQQQLKSMVNSPAAAATGGRKQAGNIITLPGSVTMASQDETSDVIASSTKNLTQQLKCSGGKSAGGAKTSRRQSTTVRKTHANTQTIAQSSKYHLKTKPQPMPLQQRRLTAATIERQDNVNRGLNRRLSCTETVVSPPKIPRTVKGSGGFLSGEVTLAEQQLLLLQEQRRKVQLTTAATMTSAPPPLHPLHNRKPRGTPQQHRTSAKKRLTSELEHQQRMEELQQQTQLGVVQQLAAQPPQLTPVTGPLLSAHLSQLGAPPLVQIIAPPLSDVGTASLNGGSVATLAQINATPLMQVTGPLLGQSTATPLLQVTAPPLVQVATSLAHQQEQIVDSPNISEEQLAQIEQFSLEDMKNVVAVRAGPIPGYPDIFVLYKLVENSVTMFQQGPYYLNHDLNQLVQVPPEALEGIELTVDQPSPDDIVNLLQQAQGTQLDALEAMEPNSPTPFICLGSPEDEETAPEAIVTESEMEEPELISGDINGDSQVPLDGESENSAGNYVLITIGDQQLGCKVDELAQLLANPDDPHIITINGTPFVLPDDVINALRVHTEEQQRQIQLPVADAATVESNPLSDEPGAADILAVALAGTELYGNDVLEIETSQALQLMGADDNIVFQQQVLQPAHLTPPITAHTSETNAILNQTPIMSTLEKPSTGVPVCHGPTLDDSLAVIGLTTQPSAVPTSLELPITVTNPAIAPKITMATSHTDIVQFPPPRSMTVAVASEARNYNDLGS